MNSFVTYDKYGGVSVDIAAYLKTPEGQAQLRGLTPLSLTSNIGPMGKSNQERQLAFVAKREKSGWKRFQAWVHLDDLPLVKRYTERLAKRRERK